MKELLPETFLAHWESPRRALITNLFCYAVREGCKDEAAVCEHVRAAIRQRAWYDSQQAAAQGLVRLNALLDSPEAHEFAASIIERERLPREERERQKAERASFYQQEYMRGKPPTEKQISFLKKLGCLETPRDRAHASELISAARGCA